MIRVFILWSLLLTMQYAICFNNYETNLTSLKKDTKDMIKEKEKKIIEEVKNYENALKAKKKAMIELLKTVRGIEYLMKKNQLNRKKITQEWMQLKDAPIILENYH